MRSKSRKTMPATLAFAVTLMRKFEVVETIDSNCTFDHEQRVLTPGEVVLILVGATFLEGDRIALYNIRETFSSMDIRGMLGREVDIESLNDHTLARGLDTIYDADRDQMLWDISARIEQALGIIANIFHVDQTKIRTFVIVPPECDPEAATPEFGLDKEGRTDFRLYSANSITDENRIIRYLSPGDGNASDSSMDFEAIKFLLENVEPANCVAVIDSKGTTVPLLTFMDDENLGFVTKVPVNFSSCMKKRIAQMVFNEGWTRSELKEGHWFFDVDMMIDGDKDEDGTLMPRRKHRIVAFRTEKMLSDRRASIQRSDLKFAEKLAKDLRKQRFESKALAMEAAGAVQEQLCDNAYSLIWQMFKEEVQLKRERGGRPKKGELPKTKVQWKILCAPKVDEEKRFFTF